MMLRIQQQSGFIELGEFHFDEAGQLFRDGQLDVREVRMESMSQMLWFIYTYIYYVMPSQKGEL